MNAPPARLHFIDVARTYAILLALLAHGLGTTGSFERMGENELAVRQFTRTATPIFVFMFGFMIEFVYVRRARQEGLDAIRRRLLVRSFQCYVGYALTSLCSALGGFKGLREFAGSLIFFGNSRFGNILRVYAVILLLTPWIVRLRLRFGLPFVALCLAGVAATFPAIVALRGLDLGPFDNPLNVLFGLGPMRRGPSAWHSLAFVLSGMLMAASLAPERGTTRGALARFHLAGLALLAACVAAWPLLVAEPPAEAWLRFGDFTYRGANMPGYYVIGVITSVVTLIAFALLLGTREPPRPVGFLLPMGLSSLLAYTVGNMILNLTAGLATRVDDVLYLALFFAAVLAVVRAIERFPCYAQAKELLNLRTPRITPEGRSAP